MIVLDICVSDIPKTAIVKSDKNGKSYLKLVVDLRKEPDQFGNSHTLYVNQTKEQREAGEKKIYVGSGKEYVFGSKKETTTIITGGGDDDSLPF